MNFVYIEDSRVESLMVDLVAKVRSMLVDPKIGPNQIFVVGIGESGLKIASAFLHRARMDSAFGNVKLLFRALDKDGPAHANEFGWDIPGATVSSFGINQATELDKLNKTAVLLIDGVVRTGKTLLSVYKAVTAKISNASKLAENGNSVWSYAIAVNPNSGIIPTWFGTLYSPNNYVVLSRDDGTPNVAILEMTTKISPGEVPLPVRYPPVVLRVPEVSDCEFHVSYPDSMNRYKSVDRYFDHQTKSRRVFIIEVFNVPVGYLSFHVQRNTLWLDYILIDDEQKAEMKKQGVHAGDPLIRFVTSYAQSVGCTKIGAWAIKQKLDFYQSLGFQKTTTEAISFQSGNTVEEYELIVRRLEGV